MSPKQATYHDNEVAQLVQAMTAMRTNAIASFRPHSPGIMVISRLQQMTVANSQIAQNEAHL